MVSTVPDLSHYGEKGSLDRQLNRPCGLSIDSDGNILVADSDNKLVKIFSGGGGGVNF